MYEQYRGGAPANTMTTKDNVALEPTTGSVIGTQKISQKLVKKTTMRIVLTADGDAPIANVPILCGSGKASTLPAGVTYSGDFSTYAEFQEMTKNSRFFVRRLRMVTTDTANFETELIKGDRKLNNTNNEQESVYLTEYSKTSGDGVAKTLEINDFNFLAGNRRYLNILSMKNDTVITVYLDVEGIEDSADIQNI